MAVVNLKRLARDLELAEGEKRVLALTTVLNLKRYTVENHHDLFTIHTLLETLSKHTDADLVYMARKGLANIRNIIVEVGLQLPDAPPGVASSGPTREEILAGIEVEANMTTLALLVLRLKKFTDEECLAAASKMTRHKDPVVRASAVSVVADMQDQRRMLLTLLPLLLDGELRVRCGVARALFRLGNERLKMHFAEMLTAERRQIREASVWALGHLKGEDKIELLLGALKDSLDPIRARAIRGLANHQARAAAPALQQLAQEVDASISEEAKRALYVLMGKIRPPEPLIDLEELANKPEAEPPDLEPHEEEAAPVPAVPLTANQQRDNELALLEKMVAGGTKMARLDVSGKTPNELNAMQNQHHRAVGQLVVEFIRQGRPPHPELKDTYFDFLKYQELLVKRKASAQNDPKTTGSWFDTVKSKLALKGVDEVQVKLQGKVESLLIGLGKVSLPLMERGEIGIPGHEEYVRRQKTIDQALSGLKGRSGNS